MSNTNISDASAQERRAGLSWAWFADLFKFILLPLARLDNHAESFYQGLRLLGVDGTQWSLRNTQELDAQGFARSSSKGAKGAFCKWGAAVLLELGTHQPLAATCSRPQVSPPEGELTLARRVLDGIPKEEDTLLLADRLYGNPTFITAVQKASSGRCHLLVRVKSNFKGKVIERLADGSVILEVNARDERGKGGAKLRLREIRGKVWRKTKEVGQEGDTPESACTEVRLWTTLLDAGKYQAQDLLELYARRWEQELFFHELKRHTGRENLLRAGSVRGAEAEFGAMIIAASLLARQRLEAADAIGVSPVRISLTKISRAMEALLPVLEVSRGLITARQTEQIIERFMEHTAREARIPRRRSRSCQRGLRKPVCAWPRIRTRVDVNGPSVAELISVTFP